MFGSDVNNSLKRGFAGAFGGQAGLTEFDNRAQNAEIFGMNRDIAGNKMKAQEAESQEKQLEKFRSLMGDTVAYVSQLPPDPLQREMGAKAYMQTMGADPQMISRLEQSGSFKDLTDQKLQAFAASMRQEQVLSSDEALIGRDGQPIYANRPNEALASGSILTDGQGGILASNPKPIEGPNPTADMQNYAAAKAAGFDGSFYDYQTGLKQAGRATTSVSVAGDQKPSAGQEAVDKAYASDYVAWTQGGGSDTLKQVTQLSDALDTLNSGRNITGSVIGLVPDRLLALGNPEAVDVKNKVEEVVQRNLRLILGAQFTNEEGKRLIDRAYNPQMSEDVNAKRVGALITQIKLAAESKEDAARYFEKNGTLRGWTGKTYSKSDFEAAIDSVKGEASSNRGASNSNFTQDADGSYVWTGN